MRSFALMLGVAAAHTVQPRLDRIHSIVEQVMSELVTYARVFGLLVAISSRFLHVADARSARCTMRPAE